VVRNRDMVGAGQGVMRQSSTVLGVPAAHSRGSVFAVRGAACEEEGMGGERPGSLIAQPAGKLRFVAEDTLHGRIHGRPKVSTSPPRSRAAQGVPSSRNAGTLGDRPGR